MPVELPVHVSITAVFAGGTHSGFLTHKFNMKSGWVQDTNDFKILTKSSFFETSPKPLICLATSTRRIFIKFETSRDQKRFSRA